MSESTVVWVLEESEGYEHRMVQGVYATREAGVRAVEVATTQPGPYGHYKRADRPDGGIDWLDPQDWYRYHLTRFPVCTITDSPAGF